MHPLPEGIITILTAFAPLFSDRVWQHAQVLLIGALLAPGKRTVTSVLSVMGLSKAKDFASYHRVLNRAVWHTRQGLPAAGREKDHTHRLLSRCGTVF